MTLTILEEAKHPTRDRNYYLINTLLGRYVYYTMAADNNETATYKNLTEYDVFWSHMRLDKFLAMFVDKPVETFVSKRISFPRERILIDCGSERYQLAEPRKPDGYLYEIPASELRAFPGTRFPNMKFAYTRYNIAALRALDRLAIERLKTEETIRFNRGYKHSKHAISAIVDEVFKYLHKGGD